jgi:Zn-dependent protease
MLLKEAFHDPLYYVAVVLSVMVSICLHELAHGIAAIALGDRTPIELQRITMNPLVHMGGMSLAALFLVGIAWGSMPINPARLRGRFGESLVAFAGPLSNFLLAIISLTIVGLWMRNARQTGGLHEQTDVNGLYVLLTFGFTNTTLALFNLIPCPPLDGSHIAANLFPGLASSMRSSIGPGGGVTAFLILFLFAGKILSPATSWLCDKYLDLIHHFLN